MTETNPWSDGQPLRKPTSFSSKKTISSAMIVVLLSVGFGIGVVMTLIVNWATMADKERDRARAVANLQSMVEEAESLAKDEKKLIDDAQNKSNGLIRQADEASRQLGDARKDASSVRSERDEARGIAAAAIAVMDKANLLDANPAALPVADLSKAIGGVKSVRCMTMISLKTPLLGVTDAEAKFHLSKSLAGIGLNCSDQSPVEMMLLVSFSDDQPRRALGVMLLVTRMMKVPGEAMSKQSAVWGQQRTSLVNEASASSQLEALILELVTAMNLELAPAATSPVAPAATPPVAPAATSPVAPAATPPVAPAATPPVAPAATSPVAPAATSPVAPAATPPVAPAATPPVAPAATSPVAPPANAKP